MPTKTSVQTTQDRNGQALALHQVDPSITSVQVATSNTSAVHTLDGTTKELYLYASGADVRVQIDGTASPTASSTSQSFIVPVGTIFTAGIDVGTHAAFAYQAISGTGTLEVIER